MQLDNFIVAFLELLSTLMVGRHLVKLKMSETYNPPPEHVLAALVELRPKLVHHTCRTVAIERASVVV